MEKEGKKLKRDNLAKLDGSSDIQAVFTCTRI